MSKTDSVSASVFEGYHEDLPGQSSFPFLSIGLKQLFSATNKKQLVSASEKTRDAPLLQSAESYKTKHPHQSTPPPNIGSPQSTQERRATRRPATPKPRKAGLVTVRNSAAVLGPLDVVVQTVKSPSVTCV